MKSKFISLFSGAMGLDIGLEKAGFEPLLCVENDKSAVETIKANRPNLQVFDGSITDINKEKIVNMIGNIEDIDLIAGGPPCQSFSVFGKRLGIKDARGQLIFEFLRLVDEIRPKTFIMENVRGLLSMSLIPNNKTVKASEKRLQAKGSLMQSLFEEYKKLGYSIDCYVVNAVNYGAPQLRERVIIIGNRMGIRSSFPEPTHSNREEDNLLPFKTLGDAIGPNSNFKDNCPEVMDFSPRKLGYLAQIPEGGNWRSLPVEIQMDSMGKSWYLKGGRSAYWRKLSFAFPSPTVVTMPNHAGTSMCHPQELRAISVGEAAAIQEFPSSWIFKGTTTEKFKQIGNAVPVRLAELAGKEAANLISKTYKINSNSVKDARMNKIRPHVRTRTFWKNGKAFSGVTSYYEVEAKKKVTN